MYGTIEITIDSINGYLLTNVKNHFIIILKIFLYFYGIRKKLF